MTLCRQKIRKLSRRSELVVLGFEHTGAVLEGQVDIMSGLLRLLLGVSFSGTSGRQRAVVLLSRFVDQLHPESGVMFKC